MVKSSPTSTNPTEPRLSPEEFVLQAIERLREERFGKGIHTVHSGFNKAFREYYGNEADPVAATDQMRKDGKIAVLAAKGGVRIYRRGDLKEETLRRHDAYWAERDEKGPEEKKAKPVKGGDPLEKILKKK